MGRLYLILLLGFISFFSSCKKDVPYRCDGSVYTVRQLGEEQKYIQPYHPGDSLSMRVFHRVSIDSDTYAYSYLGIITMVATDSFSEDVYEPDQSGDDCNDEYISVNQVLKFTGDSTLDIRMKPKIGEAVLEFSFASKDFKTSTFLINRGGEMYFRPAMEINGKWYDNVNLFPGFAAGNWGKESAYNDSTYLFYNTQQGILRAVIDDEYIFEKL